MFIHFRGVLVKKSQKINNRVQIKALKKNLKYKKHNIKFIKTLKTKHRHTFTNTLLKGSQ